MVTYVGTTTRVAVEMRSLQKATLPLGQEVKSDLWNCAQVHSMV